MREGWNIHNDIGAKLESLSRTYFGYNYDNVHETIFVADNSASDNFFECVILLLRKKYEFNAPQKVADYIYTLRIIKEKSPAEMQEEELEKKFAEFLLLMGETEA